MNNWVGSENDNFSLYHVLKLFFWISHAAGRHFFTSVNHLFMKVVARSENDFNALIIGVFVLAVGVVRLIIVPIDAKESIFAP